jgi:hypothetical protein
MPSSRDCFSIRRQLKQYVDASNVHRGFLRAPDGRFTEVNIVLPASVPRGTQQVVVTVGGVSSPPVNVEVQ